MPTRAGVFRSLSRVIAVAVATTLLAAGVVATSPQAEATPAGAVPAEVVQAGTVATQVAAATKTGKVKVVVTTPKGVPATVVLTKGAKRVNVAKKAAGTSTSVKRSAGTGTWKVSAKPVQYNGKVYVAKVTTTKAKVKAGKTTTVKVVYKAAKTVSTLRVASVTTTKIKVTYKKPKSTTQVRVRYKAGTKAPTSVTAGKAVKAGKASATLTGLKPGTTYTIAVFTKVGKTWAGPLTYTVGTNAAPSSTKTTSTYVAAPTTVLATVADKVTSKATSTGVSTTLPAGVTPVIGQAVVLPISSALPGGFVGTVSAIAADGKTVALKQAALTDAFDYLDVSVPDLSMLPAQVASIESTAEEDSAAAPLASGALSRAATTTDNSQSTDSKACKVGADAAIKMNPPSFAPEGRFTMTLRTNGAALTSVPSGVAIDTKLVLKTTVKYDLKVKGGVSCTLKFASLRWNFQAGPVPLLLTAKLEQKFDATGAIEVKGVGATVTAGFEAKPFIPLPGSGEKFTVTSKTVGSLEWLEPEATTATGKVSVKLGGTLEFGPGRGEGVAGAHAGISGTLYPIVDELSLAPGAASPWCLTGSAGGEMEAKVFAKAWVAGWKAEASYSLVQRQWTYSDGFTFPKGCTAKQGGSDPEDPEPTPGATPGPTTPDWPPTAAIPGQVWAWGINDVGQLGDGTTNPTNDLTRVPGLTDVVSVAAGHDSAYAVKSDGTLWAWGGNNYGQLGDGSVVDRHTPVQVAGLTQVRAVVAKNFSALAVTADGKVWAWGQNVAGQLGDGSKIDRHIPVQVPGLSDVRAVALTSSTGHALKSDGSVWEWGNIWWGPEGASTPANGYLAAPVADLSEIVAIAAGPGAAYALGADGTLWAWGSNDVGQLGTGTTVGTRTPVRVPGLDAVSAVAAGDVSAYALKSNGTVWAWGYNATGQLGDGTFVDRHSPTLVPGLSNVTTLVAGTLSAYAIDMSGTLWSWGNAPDSALSDAGTIRELPDRATNISGILAMGAGQTGRYAILPAP